MRTDVARDLSDGAYDFMRVVWPGIKHLLGVGEIKPVEAVAPGELQRDLDMLAGIDAWHISDGRTLMRGIASRVQWIHPDRGPYRSFTIRMERPNGSRTEFEKRCEAIDRADEGWLLPHLTVQAYVQEPRRLGELISAGVVKTRDLYEFARDRIDGRPTRRNPQDGVLFTPWWWDELKEAGIRVAEVPTPKNRPATPLPQRSEAPPVEPDVDGVQALWPVHALPGAGLPERWIVPLTWQRKERGGLGEACYPLLHRPEGPRFGRRSRADVRPRTSARR